MPRTKVSFDTVRKIALELPDVEDATAYGSPAFKVRGKMFACIAVHKSAEPNSLMVRVDFDRRAELLEAAPEIYYVREHYEPYPAVLVRLSAIRSDALRDLLGMSCRFVTAKKPARKRPI